jgi:hypothetical protein
MLPKIKRILYATDLSPNSKYAFRYAINSAIQHDAKIIILHVLEPVSPAVHALMESYLDEEMRKKIFDEKITYAIEFIEKRLRDFRRTTFSKRQINWIAMRLLWEPTAKVLLQIPFWEAPPKECCVAHANRYLLFRCPKLKKISP